MERMRFRVYVSVWVHEQRNSENFPPYHNRNVINQSLKCFPMKIGITYGKLCKYQYWCTQPECWWLWTMDDGRWTDSNSKWNTVLLMTPCVPIKPWFVGWAMCTLLMLDFNIINRVQHLHRISIHSFDAQNHCHMYVQI